MLETAIQKPDRQPVEKAYDLLGPTLAKVESRLEQTFLSSVELIPEVSNHLIGAGGKRIRPVLLLLTARVLDVDAERVADLAVASELFHNASLLHDDVVDRSELRRGVPAAP
ncbi:MAG: polyprenyl synthetase family protein, partial [Deltaproteobacteria bacterium]|nr:polyprenyl synthetase family protein [Deltaproteobacteria bacterium]